MYLRIVFTLLGFLFLFNGATDYWFYRTVVRPLRQRWISVLHWSVNLCFLLGVIAISVFFMFGRGRMSLTMMFTFIYFLVYIPKLSYLLFALPSSLFPGRKRIIRSVACAISLSIFCGFLYGLTLGRSILRTEPVEIDCPRLPAAFNHLRIVHISDIHLGNLIESSRLVERSVQAINALQPDLICFTGDLVNSRSEELEPFRSILSALKAPLGVYAVLGNHDYSDYSRFPSPEAKQENFERLIEGIRSLGWTLLNNEHRQLHRHGDSITVAGVENWGKPPFPRHGDLEQALAGTNPNEFTLLLSHNPDHWREEVQHDPRIDLTLSGHTHAMQFALRAGTWSWSAAQYTYPQWGGLYRGERNTIYVNEGIGYVFIPFRLGTQPEITLITLHKQQIQ